MMRKQVEPPCAAIFDMDGVLVDSNPFHLQKWEDFLTRRGIPFDPRELPRLILGQRNDTAFRHFFGPDLSREESRRMSEELEADFRRSFRPHAKPLQGLERLVGVLQRAGVPMAVASSAMTKNVQFVVEALGFGRYFERLVSGDEVTRAKPDPEIYLLAAGRLAVSPASIAAFEDSFVGVESAKRAGMKCVAIASTFPADELRARTQADLIVGSFEELDLAKLRRLWPSDESRAR